MSNIAKAHNLAKAKHWGQKYGDKDYFDFHILGVYELTKKKMRGIGFPFHLQFDVLAVSLLHDILEDTDCTEDYIRNSFGDLVADAVVAITKVKGEEYLHYLDRVIANPIAKFVKVQDIKFNKEQVKICIEKGEDLDKMLNLFKKYNKAEYYLGIKRDG